MRRTRASTRTTTTTPSQSSSSAGTTESALDISTASVASQATASDAIDAESDLTTPRDPRSRRNATHWSKSEDAALANAILEVKVFEAARGASKKAWDDVLAELKKASYTGRSVAACKARLEQLLENERAKQAAALRASGINEAEPSEHDRLMESLLEKYNERAAAKKTKADDREAARNKATAERHAGAELRDAAMRGIVPRKVLSDLGNLPTATPREISGQRAEKRQRSVSELSSPSSSDKDDGDESAAPERKRRKHQRGELVDLSLKLDRHRKDDNDKIAQLIALGNKQHEELVGSIKELTAQLQQHSANKEAELAMFKDLIIALVKK